MNHYKMLRSRKGLFLLDKIKIWNEAQTESIELPRTNYRIGGDEVKTSTQMASGKIVEDVIGYRIKIMASWEYIPDSEIKKLHKYLRESTLLKVGYHDIVNGDTSGMFRISYPDTGIFKFLNGIPMWYGAKLTMVAQEVL